MAKQTFTVGQVLTAAQLTSLQQTAMLGGAASAKTASYTLVAADAGTTISMTSTSATTITVNTGLFAAGDTVFIQNLGSGNLTITAGTATVATAGSLILPQNDAGILYFVSTSSSVFYDFIQAGAVSPLTTKGDLYTFSTSDDRLGVGADGTVLTAASGQATGLEWATPASGSMTLLSTTTLSGASVTISGIDQTYETLRVVVFGVTNATGASDMYIAPNGSTTESFLNANYRNNANNQVASTTSGKYIMIYGDAYKNDNANNIAYFEFDNYADTDKRKTTRHTFGYISSTASARNYGSAIGYVDTTSAITSLVFSNNNAYSFNGGTVLVYGVK